MRRVAKVGRIKPIKGLAPARPMAIELPAFTGQGIDQLDLTPPGLADIVRRIGSARAKRVWKLMQRGILASIPELCTYDWLERKPWLQFQFQSVQMGGRLMLGGAIVDFIISGLAADGLYIWRVQGDYWHKAPDIERKDDVQKSRLLRIRVGGVPIVQVVDLWETDIYDRYPEVFEMAEAGVGLRG